MKQLIKNYSFSSTSKTVTLTDFSTVRLERLQAIIDATQNKFLYNLVDPTVASATVAGNVITLSSVNGAANGDALEIIYDSATGDPVYDLPQVEVLGTDGTNTHVLGTDTSGNAVLAGGTITNSDTVGFTAPSTVANFPLIYNGSTYDRQRSANTLSNTNGKGLPGVGLLGQYSSSAPAYTANNYGLVQIDAAGNLKVNIQASGGSGSLGSVELTDGTNTANVLANDTGLNSLATSQGRKEYGSLSAAALNADLFPSTDISGYKSASIYISGTYSGTLTFQGSNDNTNFITVNVVQVNGSGAILGGGTTSTTNVLFAVPLYTRYLRIRMTAYTSGTANGTLELFTYALSPLSNAAVQAGTWSIGSSSSTGSSVPSNAFYLGIQNASGNLTGINAAANVGDTNALSGSPSVATWSYNGSTWDRVRSASTASGTTGTGLLGSGILAQYNSSAPTVSTGNYNVLQLDSSANLKVNIAAGNLTSTDASDGSLGTSAPTKASLIAGEDASSNLQAAGVVVAGTANSTGNSILTASSTFSATWSASTATTTTATDAGNYAWVSVQVSAYSSGTITFQCSNDNTNWYNTTLNQTNVSNGSPTTSGGAADIWTGPLSGRYFRLNITGGTVSNSGTITFFSTPRSSQVVGGNGIQIQTNATTGSAVPTNAFYMGLDGSSGNLTGAWGLPQSGDATTGSGALVTGNLIYNGTTWDRTREAGAASGTAGTGLLGAGILGQYNSSAPTVSSGNYNVLQLDSSANVKVNVAAALPAGTNTIGNTVSVPATSGGLSSASGSIGATVTAIKASAGQVYGWYFYNNNTTQSYVQFFNAATGSVTLGTTAPLYSLAIPANGGSNAFPPQGIAHSAAITIAITTTRSGSTGPAATVDYNIFYD